jgi:Ca2+/Na+ antiporter
MGAFIDPKDLPQDGSGLLQVLFLGAVYAFVLFNASNMISDGSELLLLVPAMAGIVGSVVLPVLGAVPDGAIVLFSGMGPDAQEQMSVGVGALAGSTIMLLTIPWALSVYAGRVNLDAQGRGNYVRPKGAGKAWSKLTPAGNANLFHTGVVLFDEIPSNAKTMIVTSLIYLILQIPALQFTGTAERDSQIDHAKVAASQRPFAFVAFLIAMVAFVGYLYWNVKRSSQVATDEIDEIRVQAIRSGKISLSGVLAEEVAKIKRASPDVNTTLTSRSQIKHVQDIIRPFFHVYDQNRDRRMDADELQVFFRDLGEKVSREEAEKWIVEADKNKSGFIEFDELVEATLKYLIAKYELESQGRKIEMTRIHVESQRHIDVAQDDDGEEEEDEAVPEDLAHLSIAEQQRRIKIRAAYMMFIGTALVLIFSDPMVDVLSEIGARTGVPAFYVSFVIAPLASNASELIASYNYALKKTSKTVSISISTLLGAACMNNTFCLGIFAALMYFKSSGLVWEFSAETLAILLVELIIGVIALKKTQRLFDALIVFALYPLSIVLVYVLENVAGLD